jgi:hypothetical protein
MGDRLIALRSFGVMGGMLAWVAVLFAGLALARLLRLDRGQRIRLLLVALAMAALSPPLVEMSREVRPYPWLILAYGGAIASMLRLADAQSRGRHIGWGGLLPYLASVLALLWLHNLGVIYVLGLTLGGVMALAPWRWSRAEWHKVLLGHVLVVLLWLPGVFILAQQSHDWIAKTWLTFNPARVAATIFDLWAVADAPGLFVALGLMAAGLIQNWVRRRSLGAGAMLLICALVPPLVAAAVSALVAPIFLRRTLTAIAIPALLLMALGAAGPARGGNRVLRWGLMLAAGAMIILLARINYYNRQAPFWEDWYQVVDQLRDRIKPGDEIWTYPNEAALPLSRALSDRGLDAVVRPLPVPVPALGVRGKHPTGSRSVVSITRVELRAIASTPQARRIPTIWTIRQGSNAYDPENDLPAVMAEQRDEIWHWYRVPIEVSGYRRRAD